MHPQMNLWLACIDYHADCRQQNTNLPIHHRNIFPSVRRWLALASDFPSSSLAFILIYSFSSYCALLTAWSLRQRTLRHATLPVRFPVPDKSGDDRLLSVCFGPPYPIGFTDCVDTFTYCFLKTAFQRNRARIYCLTRPGLWAHV